MKKIHALIILVLVAGFAATAHADLDGFIRRVNEQARADLGRFNVRLSAQFGIPVPRIGFIMKRVAAPADAFMVLQLGLMTGRPPEAVLRTYERSRGKGWGVIAKELGIKPGSREFHALKRGNFRFAGEREDGSGRGRAKAKGKGKHKGKKRH